jgi:DNA polymerase-4
VTAGVAAEQIPRQDRSDWRKPDGLFVIQPEDVQTFLPPPSVGRIPAVGKVTETRLKQMGISTVGDLKALELAALEAQSAVWALRNTP